MRIIVRHAHTDQHVAIDLPHDTSTTALDLVRCLPGPPLGEDLDQVTVDGIGFPIDTPLDDLPLADGCTLGLGTGRSERPTPGSVRLVVWGGLRVGEEVVVRPGSVVVGADPRAELSIPQAGLAPEHARLDVDRGGRSTLVALGRASNATHAEHAAARELREQHPVRLGTALVARTRATAAPAPPPPRVHQRPPRHVVGDAVPTPPTPVAPVPEPRPPLSWAGVVTPVVLGGVAAIVFSPVFALLALLSPVVVLASWAEQRRRHARRRRVAQADHEAALRRYAAELHVAAELERRRRDEAHPSPALLLSWPAVADPRLWERRRDDLDALALRLATASSSWEGTGPAPADAPTDLQELLARHTVLHDVPVVLDLAAERVVGIIGPPPVRRAVARSLVVQAALLLGPADLAIAVAAAADVAERWAWTTFLPHCTTDGGGVACSVDERAALLATGPHGPDRWRVVVVDGPGADDSNLRRWLDDPPPGQVAVVLGERLADLPRGCRAVVQALDDQGRATLRWPARARERQGLHLDGVTGETAAHAARLLARVRDPLVDDPAHAGGAPLRLGELPEIPGDVEAIGRRWERPPGPHLRAAIGRRLDGTTAVIDLVADGPHTLVGGTTGSGKSELLRALVVSLALDHDPDDCAFVLVDYKGGSAFDRCASLPHVAGMVTDLDGHLGARMLRSLDAELRRREQLLRAAGCEHLAAFQARRHADPSLEPVPRLIVVIDEFAALAADLRGFLDSLVGVAQRGRSLGLHLVLATQRPSGAISDAIRTNTSLRVALRVLDATDSVDILGVPDASGLPRHRPGRALVRLGPGEVGVVQVARVSAPATAATRADARRVVALDPFGRPLRATESAVVGRDGGSGAVPEPGESDLDRFVEAILQARARQGRPPTRPLWCEPLPPTLHPDATEPSDETTPAARTGPAEGFAPVLGLEDDPDHQRQQLRFWRAVEGPLVLYGMPGSGTTAALCALAVTATRSLPPDRLTVYAVDGDGAGLAGLAGVPHVADVVGIDERARLARLVDRLGGELRRRRTAGRTGGDPHGGPGEVTTLLVIDQFSSLRAACDDLDGFRLLDDLLVVVRDGSRVGIHTVLTTDRPAGVPPTVVARAPERIVLRLADPADAALVGLPRTALPTDPPPGRGVTGDGHEIQLTTLEPHELVTAVDDVCRRWRDRPVRAVPVRLLPHHVDPATLDPRLGLGEPDGRGPWQLPVALADEPTGATALLTLPPGRPTLVAGPPGSGRSGALAQLRRSVGGRHDLTVVEVGGRHGIGLRALPAALARVVDRHVLVLVDDVHRLVTDPAEEALLGALVAAAAPRLRVVLAADSDRLRHPGDPLTRAHRPLQGLLLHPEGPFDGSSWAAPLPRLPHETWPPGRGLLITPGRARLVQVAAACASELGELPGERVGILAPDGVGA